MEDSGLVPVELGPNQPAARPYRGGAGIARLRGIASSRDDVPEDFLASTTEVAGGGAGLTVLADGRSLLDHVRADPAAWMGPEQARASGDRPALLVKLLDTAQRLFVHCHPDDAFARQHLNCRYGKTEAWHIIDPDGGAAGGGAAEGGPAGQGAGEVYVGFRREVPAAELACWVRDQDTGPMLAALNKIPVRPGDSLLIPAGVPHAIGPGVTLVELQEPTDFSVLLEWRGYDALRPQDAHLGLGLDLALRSVDRSAWTPQRLAGLREVRPGGRDGVTRLFPPAADRFFRAELLDAAAPVPLSAEFGVLVVLAGTGTLSAAGRRLELRRGSVILLPAGAGPATVTGPLRAIRCLPPAPPGAGPITEGQDT